MNRLINISLVLLLLLMAGVTRVSAQAAEERTRILFLLDASGSMSNPWSNKSPESKWESAKKILTEIVDSLDGMPNVEIGLRVYGHLSSPTERNCRDTRLEAGFSKNSAAFIKLKLQSLKPKGITPITYSLQKAAGDFPDNNARNIIILMTDGVESCDGDPCEVAEMLEKQGIVLKHFVIGFGLAGDTASIFDCIGSNYTVNDSKAFKSVMSQIMTRIFNQTTSQVNLLNSAGQPMNTDLMMSFYSDRHRIRQYDMYHTMMPNGLPDTLGLDPVHDYELTVHTLPPVNVDHIKLTPDKHNIIVANTAQGKLVVNLKGNTVDNNLNNQIKCIVRNKDGIVFVQPLNSEQTYLEGNYQIELLTLPRITMNNVPIKGSQPYHIDIPAPGIVTMQRKIDLSGGIFIMKDGRLEKIYDLVSNNRAETIALQPGSYTIVYRATFTHEMHSTKTITFEVRSGETLNLNL